MAYNREDATHGPLDAYLVRYLSYCTGVRHLAPNSIRSIRASLYIALPLIKKWDKETAYYIFSKSKNKDVTINKKIGIISAYADWLSETSGVDTKDFITAAKRCRIRCTFKMVQDILTKEEVQSLMNTRHSLLFSFLYYTGARIQEVLDLVWSDISLSEGYVVYRYTKNKEDRKVYLPEVLVGELKKIYIPTKNKDRLFHLTSQSINRALHGYAQSLGINKKISSHIFRRSLINHLGNDGAPLPIIRSIVGHKSMDAITHYLQIADINTQKQIQCRHNPILQEFATPKDWLDSEEKRLRERDLSKVPNLKHMVSREGNRLIYTVWF